MRASLIEQAAGELRYAASINTPCKPVRDLIGETDIPMAYAVQSINTRRRVANGEVIVGKKIGLTSLAVQQQLGVDQPDFGMLFHSMQVEDGGDISFSRLMQPKAEAEIAFVLGKDLTQKVGMDELIAAIDHALCAIEIVGSRVESWNIRITDTIADNASASHFVLGREKKKLEEINLLDCKMQLFKNGQLASEGVGSACLGNPLNAALWLANTMIDLGSPLRKGEIILSGALGPMVVFDIGDHLSASIEGLGVAAFHCI